MNKMFQKLQGFGQKAAHLQQVVAGAPARAAQLRESVLLTAGQLRQMRAEVQGAVTGLTVDNEEWFTQALREISGSAEIFREAGYRLTGLDMELGLVQRLIVHLEKVSDVDERTLRALLSSHAARPTMASVLASLIKAESLAGKMSLTDLSYRGLMIYVGPTPALRLCWTADAMDEEVQVVKSTAVIPSVSAPPPAPRPAPSSFFEPRPKTPAPVSVTPPAVVGPPPVAAPTPVVVRIPKSLAGIDWKQESLERFKQMPGVSKYRR